MKQRLLFPMFALLVIAFLATSRPLTAQPSNFLALQNIVSQRLPQCQFYLSCSGTFYSLAAADGKQIQISMLAPETPQPVKDVIGYWYSPLMDFLARQKLKAATESDAISAVQLYHALCHGTNFVRQKLYHGQRFADAWVVSVEHDFTNYPGNIQGILPYELKVDANSSVVQFRERCYYYPGTAAVYTNTLTSVYEREVKIQNGMHYPEAAERELRAAWKNEQQHLAPQKH